MNTYTANIDHEQMGRVMLDVVTRADHEQAMAEKDREIADLKRTLHEWEITEHQEQVEKLEAQLEQLKEKVAAYEGGYLHDQLVDQAQKIEQQAKEIERFKSLAESWRNIQQEEMCYTMREVAALGIDFDKSVLRDGKCLWDVCMERIAALRKAETQNTAMREALQLALINLRAWNGEETWPAYKNSPEIRLIEQALTEHGER